jgi:Tfp pilus assembly protein PilE
MLLKRTVSLIALSSSNSYFEYIRNFEAHSNLARDQQDLERFCKDEAYSESISNEEVVGKNYWLHFGVNTHDRIATRFS